MITLHLLLQPQYNMNFIFISHHFTAREDMNSINWPRSQRVASQLSWSSIAPVSRRSRFRILLKPWCFFRVLSSNCLNWKIYCADHSSPSSTTAVQYKFHLYFTDREAAGKCMGSRDGAVVRALASHRCGPGSIPGSGVICGLSLLVL